MSDYNLRITVRNAHLLRAIRSRFESAAEWARALEIPYTTLMPLITMKKSPFKKDGDLIKPAELLCFGLEATPDELWPPEIVNRPPRKSTAEVEIAAADLPQIMDESPERIEMRMLISNLASDLNPREARAISIRYEEGATWDDIGKEFGVTRERARQITIKAEGKMKRSAYCKGIKNYNQAAL